MIETLMGHGAPGMVSTFVGSSNLLTVPRTHGLTPEKVFQNFSEMA